MEHGFYTLFLGIVSGLIMFVSNAVFEQGWGVLQFFVIWIILLVICYGGFFYLGDDVF